MLDVWNALVALILALGKLFVHFLLHWSLLTFWIAWWLFGINWHKARPVLSRGAWVPFCLLVVLFALAWSQLFPASRFGLPNFWWQLVYVAVFAFASVCCGWLQEVMGWAPAEIRLDAAGADHGHGHHGHGLHDHGQHHDGHHHHGHDH